MVYRRNFSQSELKELFVIATSQTHFIFRDSFYDQTDGVAMGSPLGPGLANLSMGHHERKTRRLMPIFSMSTSTPDILILSYTMEKEVGRKLAFLDVLINNSSSTVITKVFRKKTFKGLLTNFFSFTSYFYKLGLIRTRVDKTFKINNTWSGFHKNVMNLVQIPKKNLFPSHRNRKRI